MTGRTVSDLLNLFLQTNNLNQLVELAAQVLKDHGYIHSQTMVVAACVDDRPGGLAVQLQSLADHGINIEYLYAFVTTEVHEACVVLRVNDNDEAEAALGGMGVRLLSEDDIAAL